MLSRSKELVKGGRFICLEFSHMENDLLKKFYDLWSFKIMPLIGDKVTGNKEAYTYLVESIRKFPTQGELSQMFSEVGSCQILSLLIASFISGCPHLQVLDVVVEIAASTALHTHRLRAAQKIFAHPRAMSHLRHKSCSQRCSVGV